jgi:hypothetical protein
MSMRKSTQFTFLCLLLLSFMTVFLPACSSTGGDASHNDMGQEEASTEDYEDK